MSNGLFKLYLLQEFSFDMPIVHLWWPDQHLSNINKLECLAFLASYVIKQIQWIEFCQNMLNKLWLYIIRALYCFFSKQTSPLLIQILLPKSCFSALQLKVGYHPKKNARSQMDVAPWCYKLDGWTWIGWHRNKHSTSSGPHLSFTQSSYLALSQRSRHCSTLHIFSIVVVFTSYSIFIDFWAEHNFPAEYKCWIVFTNVARQLTSLMSKTWCTL